MTPDEYRQRRDYRIPRDRFGEEPTISLADAFLERTKTGRVPDGLGGPEQAKADGYEQWHSNAATNFNPADWPQEFGE